MSLIITQPVAFLRILFFGAADSSIKKSSHSEAFYIEVILKSFEKFTEEHLCWSLFFNKVENFIKRDPDTGMFLVNLAKFFRIFFYEAPANGCFCIEMGLLFVFLTARSFL